MRDQLRRHWKIPMLCGTVKWERVWYLFMGVREHWGSKLQKNIRIRPQTCSYVAGGNSYIQSVEHEVSWMYYCPTSDGKLGRDLGMRLRVHYFLRALYCYWHVVYTTPAGCIHLVQPTIKWVSALAHHTRGWNLLGAQFHVSWHNVQLPISIVEVSSCILSMNWLPKLWKDFFDSHSLLLWAGRQASSLLDNMKQIKFITKVFILLLYDIHHVKFMRWRGITGNGNKEMKFAGDNKNKSLWHHT